MKPTVPEQLHGTIHGLSSELKVSQQNLHCPEDALESLAGVVTIS